MAEAGLIDEILGFAVVGTAFGGILLCTAEVNFRRFLLALGIGAIAYLLLIDTDKPGDYVRSLGLTGQLWDTTEHILTGAFWGGVGAVAAVIVKGISFSSFDRIVRMEDEPDEIGERPVLLPRDHAKRLFVAVGAGTGGIAGALLMSPTFWAAFDQAIRPRALVGLVLATFVSTVLVGPFRDYVLNNKVSDEKAEWLDTIFSGQASMRSIVRFVLVGLMIFALELAYNCVGNALDQQDPSLTVMITLAWITPAIASYYWCFALQLQGERRGIHTAWPATLASAAMNYGNGFIILGTMLNSSEATAGPQGIGLLIGSFFIAIPIGFFMCGLYAIAGDYTLRRFRNRGALVAISVSIIAVASMQIAIIYAIAPLLGLDMTIHNALKSFVINIGWLVGLYASGFPRLVLDQPARDG